MSDSHPWLRFYGKVPHLLAYPEGSLYAVLAATARRVPQAIGWDFLDTTSTYRGLIDAIDACANALAAPGLRPGDRLLVSMPTSPQGVIAFYAANALGAVCSLIHPLSTPKEIRFSLRAARSTHALTLDAFYPRFRDAWEGTPLQRLLLARIPDYLPFPKDLLFRS